MAEPISRIVPCHLYSDIISAAMMVYSIPRIMEDVQAVVVFPGLGEDWRITHAIGWWHQAFSDFFLVAGINPRETTWKRLDINGLMRSPFFLKRTRGVETQINAAHTKEQAEWVYERVMSLGIQSLALFASPFHCLRAYLTLLKTFIDHEKNDVILIPAPTPVAPTRFIPENGRNGWEFVPGEVERIVQYQEKGDVATYEELNWYLSWLWNQTCMQAVTAR